MNGLFYTGCVIFNKMDLREVGGATPAKPQTRRTIGAIAPFPEYFGRHCCICDCVIATSHSPSKAKKRSRQSSPITLYLSWLLLFNGTQPLYWCDPCRFALKASLIDELQSKISSSVMSKANKWCTSKNKLSVLLFPPRITYRLR